MQLVLRKVLYCATLICLLLGYGKVTATGSRNQLFLPRISGDCVCARVPQLLRCPNGFIKFGSKCYKFVRMSVNWLDAKAYCEAMHAELVSAESWQETRFLLGYIKEHQDSYSGSFWTGGNNLGSAAEWRWAGLANTVIRGYQNWYPGNPDDGGRGGEHCMELERSYDYMWNDQPCDMTNHFICQIQLSTQLGGPGAGGGS